jgi:hypothetical protein
VKVKKMDEKMLSSESRRGKLDAQAAKRKKR